MIQTTMAHTLSNYDF